MKPQDFLDFAQLYAEKNSGCRKVAVGSVITKHGSMISFGANREFSGKCLEQDCHRVLKYGDDSKIHRNPEDCLAIHSEVDAIAKSATLLHGCEIYVTRYPCEGCAKAIIAAGIKTVYYGGTAEASDMTKQMLWEAGIDLIHIKNWSDDNTDR